MLRLSAHVKPELPWGGWCRRVRAHSVLAPSLANVPEGSGYEPGGEVLPKAAAVPRRPLEPGPKHPPKPSKESNQKQRLSSDLKTDQLLFQAQ